MALHPKTGRFFEPGFHIKGKKIDMVYLDDVVQEFDDIPVKVDPALSPGKVEFRMERVDRVSPVRHTELVGDDDPPQIKVGAFDHFEGIARSFAPAEAPLVPASVTEDHIRELMAKFVRGHGLGPIPAGEDDEATGHTVMDVVRKKIHAFYAVHRENPSVIVMQRECYYALECYLAQAYPLSMVEHQVPAEAQKLGVVMRMFGIPVVLTRRDIGVEVM